MAFFKFRKGGDAPASTPAESVETMRRRARIRLTGAAVLVLAGVIGFPLVFDTQPRPVAVDIPIDIPDRNKAKPLAPAAPPVAQAPAVPDPVIAAASPATTPAAPAEPVTDPAPAAAPPPAGREPAAEGKPPAKPESAADSKAKPDATAKASTRSDADAAKAKALLEGRAATAASAAAAPSAAATATPAGESRYVVQVGAFADAAKAQDTRVKLEKTGLKTYTHVAETKEGKRTRVRVGPFATRSEADKAAEKIKGLDLPAAVLTL